MSENFIVSYPKSGRSWLRMMFERLNIDYLVDHAGSHFKHHPDTEHLNIDIKKYQKKKIVFLVRNPLDILVSSYFHITHRKNMFDGNLSEMVSDPRFGIRRVMEFLHTWHRGYKHNEVNFLIVRYEDLHKDIFYQIKRILFFLDKQKPEQQIEDAIEYANFDNLKKMEEAGVLAWMGAAMLPGNVNDNNSYKMREGKVEGYKEYMSKNDIEYCRDIIRINYLSEIFFYF
jgi:hypothetical protein